MAANMDDSRLKIILGIDYGTTFTGKPSDTCSKPAKTAR